VNLLGVDFGRRRLGLARASSEGRLASPWRQLAVRGRDEALGALTEIVAREGIDLVVVGVPLAASGAETEASRRVRRFARVLEARSGVAVVFQDEFSTTREAEELAGRANDVDAVAAAVILRDYLERTNPTAGRGTSSGAAEEA
jgi:putative Holliday junction resolvase